MSKASTRSAFADGRAAVWIIVSTGVALLATIPFVLILLRPVSSVLFVRGSADDGNWINVLAMIAVLIAPATYCMFFGTAGEVLRTRVNTATHRSITRFAAAGLLPYIVLSVAAVYWTGGPAKSLMTVAALSVPIAMGATIWVAVEHDRRQAKSQPSAF